MAILTNAIVKVDLVCATGNTIATRQIAVNTLHYKCTTHAGTGATESDFAFLMGQSMSNLYKALLSSLTAYSGCRVQQIVTTPPGVAVIDTIGTGPGSRLGLNLLPTQDCGIITKHTLIGGRGGRGRLYAPFPTVDDNANGHTTVGYQVLLAAIADAILVIRNPGAGGNTSTMQPVLFHAPTAATAASTTPLSSYTIRGYFGTQRRRGEASGPDVFFPAA